VTIEIKRLRPLKPIEVRGFKVPDTFVGMQEALTQLLGTLPIVVKEEPLVQGETGIKLGLAHGVLGWTLLATTGDWIVVGEDGNVEVYTPEIEHHFAFEDIAEVQ